MSTKTLRKRIALGTVVALGAGVLSLVSVTSAHAAGNASLNTANSVGVLGSSFSTPLASTATVLSSGTLALTDSGFGYYTVSAGAYISGSDSVTAIAADQASINFGGAGGVGTYFKVTPTGAAGSTFAVIGYPSKGATAAMVLTVTIAGSSLAGVPAAAKSSVNFVNSSGGTYDTNTDLSGGSAASAGGTIWLQINLKDAYGNRNTKAGALTVTTTTGSVVNTADTSTSTTALTKGTYTTAVSSAAASGFYARVDESTAGAGWAGTITVSFNGTVLATKSATIAGYVKKIVLSQHKVASKASGAANTDAIYWNAYDGAGNSIDATALTLSNLTKNSIGTSTVLSGVTTQTGPNLTTGDAGTISVAAGGSGTSTLVMQYVNPDGTVVLSNSLVVLVGGAADTYTAKFDKSSYNQGDLATLTITFVDTKGNAASSYSNVIETDTAASTTIGNALISTPMMTLVGSYPIAKAPNSAGQLVFTYAVGTSTGVTAGNYQASVSLPTVNAADGVAQTVSYSIGSAGGTSLNDVLKGIVSLIASINKQIAALAKLVAPAKKK